MRLEELTAYEILEKRYIEDLSSTGIRIRHKKTGARISLLENKDENKVFYIAFRTPPTDSTGVAHITEHSVLCGSKKYPVKDPFVELAKGSLNTFLNAMTYPDKTVYPVASCNDKDFQNLMDVYLDAVFHPNTYTNESIFRQEGWHYEFDENENLFINGVVYNEMKGAFSSPDDVLAREIMNSLYPDTTYGVESGGDPDAIPELTYEEFLDFHRSYYHPSNSYIYLYGNMDMAEKLDYIDKEYLSKYDYREVDSELKIQSAFNEQKTVVKNCNLNEGENASENTFLSLNYSIADAIDRKLAVAFQVIDYCLAGNPGAILKNKLVDRGLGKDVYSTVETGIKQPYFSIIVKDTLTSKTEEFKEAVNEILSEVVDNGLGKKSILAAINHFEFQYREADFGSYPRGLIHGLNSLDSWLYDDNNPFGAIELIDIYDYLKNEADTGYFEELIRKYILENKHSSLVILEPKEGLEEEKNAILKSRLEEYKNSLSASEIQQIKNDFSNLLAFQEQVDSPSDLAKLPLLSVSDLEKKAKPFSNIVINDPYTVIRHDYDTSGIVYLKILFDLSNIPGKLFPYISILRTLFTELDTKKYAYSDLNNEIDLAMGGIGFVTDSFPNFNMIDEYKSYLSVKSKFLHGMESEAISLIEEILLNTSFCDKSRILDVLCEVRSQTQASIISSGHVVALNRAMSGVDRHAALIEETSGLDFYSFLCNTIDNFDKNSDEVISNIILAAKSVFRPENMIVDITGSEKYLDSVLPILNRFYNELYTEEVFLEKYVPELKKDNEGLMNSGQVLYVCKAGNFVKHGLEYNGALNILKTIMSYQYLWVNVRVKGGAYGCMCGFNRTGNCYFVSYRDPNLKNTIDIYDNAPKAISEIELDDRSMTQFIIGTISEIDQPKNAEAEGKRSLAAYMSGLSLEMVQKARDEVLSATQEDIRRLAKYLDAFLSDNRLIVVGNASKIKDNKELFDVVKNLF